MAKSKSKKPPAPTFIDVEFGQDARHKMCVWLAESDEPTPMLVSYHGGGFQDRPIPDLTTPPKDVLRVLDYGISVVVPTYRPVAPDTFLDAARALQFVRDLMPNSTAFENFDQLFDVDIGELDDLPAKKYQMMREFSPLNHITKNAPPTLLTYNRGLDAPHGVHHAIFGKVVKEKADAVGATCDLVAGGKSLLGSQKRTIPAFLKDTLCD